MAKHSNNSEQMNFAEYMKNSASHMMPGSTKYQPGQMVETKIVSISNDAIFLELNGKSEGVLDRDELLDAKGELTVKEGDIIKVFFLRTQNGEYHFTTKISGDKVNEDLLDEAYKNRIPVEGTVEKEIKGGYEIKIGEKRAFCPYSEMGLNRTEEPSNWVGKNLPFIIREYKDNGRNLIVSNKAIEEAKRQENITKLKEKLTEHSIVNGVIKSLHEFGAFVDLGAVQGLIPVSEISLERVDDISKVLAVGQEVKAEIISLDWKRERITLSLKSLLEDPWTHAEEKYQVGSKHTGTVAKITHYGAFVSLEPGLLGLIHVSELQSSGKYNNIKDAVKLGQTLTVEVLAVDADEKRISLKPARSAEEEDLSAKYLDDGKDEDTYNPFAALLKKK